MPICLIQKEDSRYLIADMPSCNSIAGELNPYAYPDAELCYEYSVRGVYGMFFLLKA